MANVSALNTATPSKNSARVSFGAKPMPLDAAKYIKSKILDSGVKAVDVYCHASPDEDTVNSAKVINNWIKRQGKITSFCVSSQKLKGLFLGHGQFKIKKDEKPADLAMILDFSSESKVSRGYLELLKKSKNVLGIDHHQVSDDNLDCHFYRDTSAASCCGIIYRLFESLGEKLNKSDLRSLYCGVLSDYQKSKLVKFQNFDKGRQLVRLPLLEADKNSKEVLEKIESQLSTKEKAKIYKHIDVLSDLKPSEKAFRKRIFSDVKTTNNGKLAYVIIEPKDKEWISLGMKNSRTSPILRDLRLRLLNGINYDEAFSSEQRQKFQNIQGAIVFYRAGGVYQMSLTTKNDYANKLMAYIRENINPNLIGGGHPDRQGARIFSIEKNQVTDFINSFLTAAENI